MPPKVRIKFPHLYAKQAAFVFCAARYTVIEAATKCGKTVACLVWLLWMALSTGAAGRNYWWVAPIFGQTKIAYRRLKRWLAPYQGFAKFNDSELTCELPNGAILWFKSADHPDGLYGEDVHAAVMDEATRCKEEAWHALRSTLTATKGPVKLIGNVKGRRNFAYQMARKAEAGAPGMAYFRLTAYDAAEAGIYDLAEIEDAKANLPE
ncbi:MAG TPA: terminase family protein, partial [Planctomycetota bacterium]|nr:terminase family protein [Planctomycetota bacterium]